MMKVASYCRVSTDKDDQANSFATQRTFFRKYILCHPDWELYEIYADEGITGTSTKKRTQFNRMINDACEGKFQMIVTKEVSRFSRNILDTIRYTRELKALGVSVLFLTDGINTMDPDAELRLSIMASIAQEESRRTSGRVTWGQTRQMEKGVVFGQSLLGYDVKGGKMTVNPEGAEIVNLIFRKYAVEQIGTTEIARFLTEAGYRSSRGNPRWKSNAVIKILKNEKYVGDIVQKKTYTADFLTHEKKTNKGEVPLIRITNHHEPIISREVWDLAQEKLRKNDKHGTGGNGHSNRYVFSGRIICGECGCTFVSRKRKNADGSLTRRWSCRTAAGEGSTVYVDTLGNRYGCEVGKLVRDDDAMNMLKTAIQSLQLDFDAVISDVTALALSAIQAGENGTEANSQKLRYAIERTERKKADMMDSYFSGDISKEDMKAMKDRYERKLEMLREQLVNTAYADGNTQQMKASIRVQIASVLNFEIKSEALCKNILHHITVFKDRHLELRLRSLPHVFQFTG